MTEIEQVLREMAEAEADTARQIAEIDAQLDRHRQGCRTWSNQHAAADAMQAHEAEAKDKRTAADAELYKRIRELRRTGAEALAVDRKAIDGAIYADKVGRGPQGAEGWQEAAARAQFVREDLAKLETEPGKVADLYEMMTAAGDTIGAALVERYGREMIEGWITERAEKQLTTAGWHMALSSLDELTTGTLQAEVAAQLDALHRFKTELNRPRTNAEQREIAQKFGIKQYD